jgi:LmbE family N-acetylglucosaminyl deacetylase
MSHPSPARARMFLRAGARPAKRALVTGWRFALLARSHDVTEASSRARCLVLAPHPDDETIGCGATIARKRARGTDVRVVVATDGRFSHNSTVLTPDELAQIRSTEFRAACALLGVAQDEIRELGLREGALGVGRADLVRTLRVELDAFRPDEVLVTSPWDWHEDHRELFAAAVAALSGHPDGPRLLAYPVWAWVDGPWSNRPGRSALRAAWEFVTDPVRTAARAQPERVTADGFLEVKRQALAEYRSQTTNLTGEGSWAVMDPAFLDHFLGPAEVFLPILGGRRSGRD